MKVLLTGHRGRLGPAIEKQLTAAGHEVRGFDRADGDDILDSKAIEHAARGVEAIVHVAGAAGDRGATPADMLAINLAGTSNMLCAAEAQRVGRVVHLSSGRALGMLDRAPDYLPIDDDHRGLPTSYYGLSKWLSEELCKGFTERCGMDTIVLRAVAVFDDDGYRESLEKIKWKLPTGTTSHFGLGAHIHLDDVATATAAAVDCPFKGHVRLLLSAADIAGSIKTLDFVRQHLSDVAWRGGREYENEPFRALVDIERAKSLLSWTPRHTWPRDPG